MGKLLKITIKTVFFLVAAAVFSGGGYALWVARDLPSPESFAKRSIVQSTKIYDRTGTVLLYEVHGEERRTVIPPEEIPEAVKQAVVAVEDERFYKHPGVDLQGIARSFFANITRRRIAQGGSTLTQQLIRNTLITRERTLARKIKEVILAVELELRYSKDEIIGFWLNSVPFGENAYGIEAAAQTFFGKHARELTLPEAAALAALPKAPSYYSPYGSNTEELEGRKNHILERMFSLGYINEKQFEEARGTAPSFLPPRAGILAPHFTLFVREYLEERYGKDAVAQEGLRVHTTLDWELQAIAERVVAEGVERNEKTYGARNASLVAMNPNTGEVLAMVGSKNYFDLAEDGNVNVALRPRQPGSAFKPFAYAAAFSKGFTPQTVVFDVPTEFAAGKGARSYVPQNYDGRFRGPVTLKRALANSLNIPSVKTLYLAGIDETIELAEAMGISTLHDRSRYGLALVLGGGEVKLFDMVSAFGVFATEGERFSATPIQKIMGYREDVIEEFTPQPVRVLDKNVARMVNDILSDKDARTEIFGSRNALTVPGHQVAVKTGTTEDFHDGWTVGYTPSIVVGVWVGNNDNSPMKKGADGVRVAAPIWQEFMKEVLARYDRGSFTAPAIQATGKPVLDGNYLVEETVKIDSASGKRATERTPEDFVDEKIFASVHSILFWTDKKNPTGPPPENPQLDPQYSNWESGVSLWLSEHPEIGAGKNLFPPPQEWDDVHTEENIPMVRILDPANGEIVPRGRFLPLKVSVASKFDPARFSFFLDEQFLKTVQVLEKNTSGTRVFVVPMPGANEKKYEGSAHELTVRVFDVMGNGGSDSVEILFEP